MARQQCTPISLEHSRRRAGIHMPNTNRPAPETRRSPPHDYRRALQKAIAWMGDRYLLAAPLPRTNADNPKYWTAPQHAAAYQSRQTRRYP